MRDDAWDRERDLRRHVYEADVARLVGRGHSVRCSQMRLLCRGKALRLPPGEPRLRARLAEAIGAAARRRRRLLFRRRRLLLDDWGDSELVVEVGRGLRWTGGLLDEARGQHVAEVRTFL